MIGLHATAMAEGIPARFVASVHSAFGSACNLVLEDSAGGSGTLVPIVAGHLPMPPGAIRVGLPPGWRFDRHLAVGQPAALRAGTLRLGADVAVTLHGAVPWRSGLPDLCLSGATIARDSAWRTAWAMVQRAPRHEASDAVERLLAALAAALTARDPGRAAQCAARLVGLGPGLTPSGDDVLVGVLTVLHGMAAEARLTPLRESLIRAVRAEAVRTTDIGRNYLLHASAGRFGEALADLASVLAAGRDPSMATEAVLAEGAHSGADGALGMLAALAALHSDPARLGFPE
jgi:hypothetical protein